MPDPQHREITGAIIIDTLGRILLQQRDDIVGIIHPGKIGLFGGHREGEETFLECIVREVYEEISYLIPADRFEYLASLDGLDLDVDGGTVRGEFFITRGVPTGALLITEGSLLTFMPDEIKGIESKLAPSARFAISAFFKNQQERHKQQDQVLL
jgi:8-oxo-dGTP diphosphatase